MRWQMPEHLIFTLTATLGSAGELAGHERRPSLGWPGRSAILGLVAAALGIRRDDAAGLEALEALSVAVAVFDAGTPLRDYHTVQTIPSAKARRPDSRPAALSTAGRAVNTTITLRDYRQTPLYGVALTGPDLAGVAKALERPVFTLYLGRKACPLSAPLCPCLVEAEGSAQALQHVKLPPWCRSAVAEILVTDPEDGQEGRLEWRNDRATDRSAWHFAARRVVVSGTRIAPAEADQ